jgi:hypothetical protein
MNKKDDGATPLCELNDVTSRFIFSKIMQILLWKQARYGRKNLEQFGIKGLTLRMNDKMQRMINKSWGQEQDDVWRTKESLVEDAFDMIGYCIILLMQHYGWLDLFEDTAKETYREDESEPKPAMNPRDVQNDLPF